MAGFGVSPGAYFRELDLSTRIATVSTSIGAAVIESDWGPAMQRTLCTSVEDYIANFGKPKPKYLSNYTTMRMLEVTKRCYVTRVVKNALHGGLIFAKAPNAIANEPPVSVWAPLIIGEPDPVNTLIMSDDMIFCVYDKSPGDHDIRVSIEQTLNGDGGFTLAVYLGSSAQAVETWAVSLERRADGFGKTMYIEDVVKRSNYIAAIVNDEFDGVVDDTLVDGNFARRRVQGGSAGDRVTSAEVIFGWELYRDPENVDINILINGGWTDPAVQMKMDDIAKDRADCIAVLDMPSDKQKLNDALNYRSNVGSGEGLGIDSSYSAIYTPDLRVYDPYNATDVMVPPSGHVAATYAYTDQVSKVWTSPAGMKRGSLNIRGVREVYNQGARDAFAGVQINPVRVVPGSGHYVWGDSTLQTRPSALQYINVRRMLCFIEKSISITLLYFVFDPNDSILRATIRTTIEDFLKPIKIGRGLADYEVVCDERNNPDYITDAGILNVDVYLKPILSTRIIQMTAVITKSGASFSELIDSGVTMG